MATSNQGRPRLGTKGDVVQVEGGKSSSTIEFTHPPLETSVDGIRLVILEPCINMNGEVHCRLEHVIFGQMPKYEALSYTWGSETPQFDIFIDHKTFPVRKNLRDALLQLRRDTGERALWIDAICINQHDIRERNQQVRIMPHIYSRAQTVLVWLGTATEEDEGLRLIVRGKSLALGDQSGDSNLSNHLCNKYLLNMSNADYWHRVWIVQEIGKARKIKLHYGQSVVDWEIFIYTIRRNLSDSYKLSCTPLSLVDQMLDRYGDGYKLENLLKTHQNALCEDVRDKVYGFTGLANDTYGRLAMDYGKSPFNVWKDVVAFRNADKSISQCDILHFARFA